MSLRRALVSLLAFGACAQFASLEDRVPGAVGLRDATWQAFFRIRGPTPAPPTITVVEVAREDLDAVGKWPWPRSLTAQLVSRMADSRPQAVALLFTYASARPPMERFLLQATRRYPALAIEESGLEQFTDPFRYPFEEKLGVWLQARVAAIPAEQREEFEAQRRGLQRDLAQTLTSPGTAETAAALARVRSCIQSIGASRGETLEALLADRRGEAVPYIAPRPLEVEGELLPGALERVPAADGRYANGPELRGAAAAEGLFVPRTDYLRPVWKEPLVYRVDGRLLPSMALSAVAAFKGVRPVVRPHGRGVAIWLGEERLPTDDDGGLWLGYYGPTGTFASVHAHEALERGLGDQTGRLVFYAQTTASYVHFPVSVANPAGGLMSQSELAITAAANLLDGSALRPVGGLVALLLFGLPAAAALYALRRHLVLALASGVGLVALSVVGGFGLFRLGLLVDPVSLWLWLGASTVGVAATAALDQRRARRGVEHAFRHYLSPQVLEEVLRHPEEVRPGGRRREVTVLFSDIRGFTSLSEARDPALVAELLNLYMEAMADCVLRNGGTIDKFIGDGLLAYFGAPADQPDHAERALRTARDMLGSLEGVRARWRERGVADLQIGIGLHTGPAIVGNMGSTRRVEYTVIGDTVNTASRVEGATKGFAVPLLFTAATRAKLPEPVGRPLGAIQVKGKEQGVEVFTL